MLPTYYKQLQHDERKQKIFSSENTVNFKPVKYTQKRLITALSYDYHGDRIACCSSDHSVQIWDSNKNEDKNRIDLKDSTNINGNNQAGKAEKKWVKTGHWTAHYGAVLKVIWFPPCLGQHIASSGSDGYVKLWMETLESV